MFIRSNSSMFALAGGLVLCVCSFGSAAPIKVELRGEPGAYELLRDGKPYFIKGAGGYGPQSLLAEVGGNSGRTWGTDDLGAKLDEAHRLGLTLAVGFWLGHPRHGFDYRNVDSVAEQAEKFKAAVLKYKDHPAVLMWSIGNEMEGEGDDAAIWSHINNLAAMAKKLDPNHPTMTVIAEMGKDGIKIKNIHRLCPDIDIIGVNTYGMGDTVGERYKKAGGTKPFIVTEFGPTGTWEIGRNDFGAPTEKTSTEKIATYKATYLKTIEAFRGQCLGSYAFIWGNKVEATTTWFGMLLPDNTRLGPADALSELWTGKPPANRCPIIEPIMPATADRGMPGDVLRFSLKTSDPEDDALTVQWVLQREITQYETGGDYTAAPPKFDESITSATALGCYVKLPEKPGVYRLYAYVRDGKGGGATASLPLLSGENPAGKKR